MRRHAHQVWAKEGAACMIAPDMFKRWGRSFHLQNLLHFLNKKSKASFIKKTAGTITPQWNTGYRVISSIRGYFSSKLVT